jgi:hypothetical protein
MRCQDQVEPAGRRRRRHGDRSRLPDSQSGLVDFAVWLKAPQERTALYFPTYSSISRVIQAALRQWVREWFHANSQVLERPHAAYQILVYFCTQPFREKATNTFTYDVQRTEVLDHAFVSAAKNLQRELETLDTTPYGPIIEID